MECVSSNPCTGAVQSLKRLTIRERLEISKAEQSVATKANQTLDDIRRDLEGTSAPKTTSPVVNSTTSIPSPIENKVYLKGFEKKRDELGSVVHKQALLWFEKAECQPNGRIAYMDCTKTNRETGKVTKSYVDIHKVLANTNVNYQSLITNLNKTQLAAYEFYLNKTIQDYKQPSLQTPANMIKDMEKITNIEDSAILKVATLHFLQNKLIDHGKNKKFLSDKYYDSWKVSSINMMPAEQAATK